MLMKNNCRQSKKKIWDAFKLNEFESMVNFYQSLRNGRITVREAHSKLI